MPTVFTQFFEAIFGIFAHSLSPPLLRCSSRRLRPLDSIRGLLSGAQGWPLGTRPCIPCCCRHRKLSFLLGLFCLFFFERSEFNLVCLPKVSVAGHSPSRCGISATCCHPKSACIKDLRSSGTSAFLYLGNEEISSSHWVLVECYFLTDFVLCHFYFPFLQKQKIVI